MAITIFKKTNRLFSLLRPMAPELSWYSASLLIGYTFVTYDLGWLIFLALLLAFYYVDNIHKYNLRRVLFNFYMSGFIITGFAFLFMFQTAPDNWDAVVTGWFVWGSGVISWLLVSLFCALPMILLGYILYKISNSYIRLIFLALLWPLFEVIRSYTFAAISYDPGNSLYLSTGYSSISVSLTSTTSVLIPLF
jgi:apolipoprotein N-acyltransferase